MKRVYGLIATSSPLLLPFYNSPTPHTRQHSYENMSENKGKQRVKSGENEILSKKLPLHQNIRPSNGILAPSNPLHHKFLRLARYKRL